MFNGMGTYPGLAPLQGLSPEEEALLRFYGGGSAQGSNARGGSASKAAPALYVQEEPAQAAPAAPPQNGLFGLLPPSARGIDAEARQKAKDEEEAFSAVQKGDWPMLGLMFGLSLMANSERNGFGGALGKAGLDTIGSYAATTAGRRKEFTEAQERALQNRRLDNAEARQDLSNRIALGTLMQQGRHNDILERKNLFDAYQKFWKDQRELGEKTAARQMLFGGTGGGAPVVPIPGMPDTGARGGIGLVGGKLPEGGLSGTVQLPQNVADAIRAEATRQGVDPVLAMAVAAQESGGRQDVVSPAGAVGVMQVMPQYVGEFGGGDPRNMADNIRLGVAELRQRLNEAGGDVREALLRYNWGPGNVQAYKKTGKGVKGQAMPREAQEYADRVFGRIRGAQPSVPPTQAGADPYAAQILDPARRRQLEYVVMYGDTNSAGLAKSMLSHDDTLRQKQAELHAKASEPQKMNDVSSLGQRWKTDSADYLDASRNLAALIDYANLKNGAGDLGLIFSYMKMLDPGSVVREGEQEQARKTAGISDQLWATLQRVQSGEVLTPAQRRQFVEAAHRRHGTLAKEQQRINDLYKRRAAAYNVDPLMVISDVYADLPKTAADWLAANVPAPEPVIPGIPQEKKPEKQEDAATPPLPPGFQMIGGKK